MSRFLSLITVFSLLVAGIVLLPPSPAARAAGSPDVQLTRTVAPATLYGDEVTVTLSAIQSSGPDGFNLTFTDILPPGATLVSSSLGGQPVPVSRTVVLPNGSSKLIWSNVADLLAGARVDFTWTFSYDTGLDDVGSTFAGTAEAFVNSDPRRLPRFDRVTGAVRPTTVTGSASSTSATTLVPFLVTKSEPSPEGELLRGVRDHKTAYTVTVTNNSVNPTTGFTVVDFLPAGLEYLGCTNTDNSSAGSEEYPGAGRIDSGGFPALTDCRDAASVTTVETDPDGTGPLPLAVSTRVEWTGLGALAAGAVLTLDYAAAVPLRENVLAPGDATANLDNNTGALTSDEQQLRNVASASGSYGGTVYTASGEATVSAEDVRMRKTVDTATIAQGAVSTWTIAIDSSQYTLDTGDIVVTDTIPDGIEYAGSTPGPDSVVTNSDGTQTVVWTVSGFSGANGSRPEVIQYSTTTLDDYRATGRPVSVNDSWSNEVSLETTSTVITDNDGRTSALETPDASAAAQSAEGVLLTKEIAEPSAQPVDCLSGGLAWNGDVTGPFEPGDRVCYRITVDFPTDLDSLDNVVTDFLPDGYSYEDDPATPDDGFRYTSASTVTEASGVVFLADGPQLRWTFPNADAGDFFQVVIPTVITDPTLVADGDIAANLAKLAYKNSRGDVFQLRDQADARLVEPTVSLAKGIVGLNGSPIVGAPVDSLAVQSGDAVRYRVTVSNTGGADATNLSVRDTLPDAFDCTRVDVVVDPITNGGACVGGQIQWDALDVPADSSLDLEYTLTIPDSAAPSEVFPNTAGVRSFEGSTNTGSPLVYVPSDNIDPTLEPDANTAPARDGAEVALGSPTLAKTVSTDITEAGNTPTEATIGEVVTYDLTVTIPEGTTTYDPRITDTVDARFEIVGTPTFVLSSDPTVRPATVAGQVVTATLPTPYVNAADSGDDTATLTIEVRVRDASGPVRGNNVPNGGTFAWSDSDGQPASVASNTVQTRVVEPDLTVPKSSDDADGRVVADQIVTFTLAITNGSGADVSRAHDIAATDRVPVDLIPIDAAGDPAADGATLPGGGVWNQTARTISFSVTALDPGARQTVTYRTRVANPVVSAGRIVNTATVTGTSLAGADANERSSLSAAGVVGSGYQASSSVTLSAPEVFVDKRATPATRTIGEKVTYTLDVTVPANVIAYDTTVIDTLPANVRFGEVVSSGCLQGGGSCAPDIAPTLIGSPTTTDRSIGFFLGDLAPAAPADRVVTIVYTGIVTPAAVSGSTLTNSARPYLNQTDKITGTPATVPVPATFDIAETADSAQVTVVAPRLTIDKDVAGQVGDTDTRRARPGDVLAYAIAVTNTGTSPAYEVRVSDAPDSRVTDFSATVTPGVVGTDSDPSDGTLAWTIAGPIAPGATVVITYSVTMPEVGAAAEVPGRELTNTADIPSYRGVAATNRLPGITYADYDNVTADVVGVELDLASIGDLVWFDVDGDGTRDPGEPGLAGVDVTVRFAGADGVFGTGDDEVRLATTDAVGGYLVTELPGGSYRVTVDQADLPAGLAPSYDLDGLTTSPNGIWQGPLAEAGTPRDVDFGFTGTGSIGDRVWYDRNADGIQDLVEPGLAGATVTVVWGGPDGDVSTAADNVSYIRVTGADGGYLVDGVPAGAYSVTVSGLPSGYDVVSDPAGGTSSTSTFTLGAGADNLDQDFGYAGTGSIGDFVWLDRDGDGVQDPTEPGIVGSTLEVTWFGTDGIAGGGDDATFPVTTDAGGAYVLDGLLPGVYSVAVTGGLPLAADNSYDRDGNSDSVTALVLGTGEIVTDVDFGYDVTSVIGDRVWWDIDADGTQDSGEPGLGGVDLRVTFLGADGVAGGGDDIVFTATTGTDGTWSVVDVPDGAFVVEVIDGVDGFAPTFDSDSGTVSADGRSSVTLVGSDLDQDFGYTGDGSLGDTVWLDLDSDGVRGAGEPGLAGATVTLVWFGPDGAAGGGDDITLDSVTGLDGAYLFSGLPAGEYSVAVDRGTLPADLEPTFDLDGGLDAAVRLALPPATDLTNVDFGFRGTASLGDTVWNDRDGDGVVDPGEPGLGGVTVTATWDGVDGLVGTADDLSFTTASDASGAYAFPFLPAGTWTVAIDTATVPAGLAETFDEDGSFDSIALVALEPGEAHTTADFGYRGAGVVGDTVWLDLDADGTRQGTEPGVPGQDVQLLWAGRDGLFGTSDDATWATRTDEDGAYLFSFLPEGAFRVSVVGGIALVAGPTADPDGGADNVSGLSLAGGASDLDQDFGYVGANSLGDTAWWDRDGDGVDDAGEPRLAGVGVDVLWAGLDGVFGSADDVVLPRTTDAAGLYGATGLPDGTYRVTVSAGIPAGLVPSVDADSGSLVGGGTPDGVSQLSLADGTSDLDQDFGFVGTGAIGDTVWLDLDGDGLRGDGEPGIPGVLVTLASPGPDGLLGTGDDETATATTDDDGAYLFDLLAAGDFSIVLSNLPAGVTATADPDGGADGQALVSLGSGDRDLDQDFGYRGDAGLGDLLWLDVDGDGVQGANEPGIPGISVTVRLAGADGAVGTADDILATVVTDADGRYLVEGVPAGEVLVSYDAATLPEGYVPFSDLDGADATATRTTLAAGATRLDADFVVVGSAALTGVVFDDRNGNGLRDAGEPGIPGAKVTVVFDGPLGPVTITVTTDDTGNWRLGRLPAGEYTATLDLGSVAAGLRASTGTSVDVTLPAFGERSVVFGVTALGLAATGLEIGLAVNLAMMLLAAGILAVMLARFRRSHPAG